MPGAKRAMGKIVLISGSKTYDLESCKFQAETLFALDILRYADVPSVDVLENELAVGSHALGGLCFRQVFYDLDAVAFNFVVEQERLGAVYVHIVLDAEVSCGLCNIAFALNENDSYVVSCKFYVGHGFIV